MYFERNRVGVYNLYYLYNNLMLISKKEILIVVIKLI